MSVESGYRLTDLSWNVRLETVDLVLGLGNGCVQSADLNEKRRNVSGSESRKEVTATCGVNWTSHWWHKWGRSGIGVYGFYDVGHISLKSGDLALTCGCSSDKRGN